MSEPDWVTHLAEHASLLSFDSAYLTTLRASVPNDYLAAYDENVRLKNANRKHQDRIEAERQKARKKLEMRAAREAKAELDAEEADRANTGQAPIRGGTFVLDAADLPPAVWGREKEVFWAEGEALMIVGPPGVGKTTLAVQVVRARLGLSGDVLGYPVLAGVGRVLYLAADRPAQARRAMKRLFKEEERATLDDRLFVWQGPPPYDLAKHPDALTQMCLSQGADTVVIDSLKDVAIGLSSDEVGAAYNRARQQALVAGVQVLELHHQVKRGANGGKPDTLADVYGSTWLTSGAGSVLLLCGDPGDPIVTLRHLKQPGAEIGPLNVLHDHAAGTSSVQERVDLVDLAHSAGGHGGLTATMAAERLFDTKNPTPAQKEKARRKLDHLEKAGHLSRRDPNVKGGAITYFANGLGSL